MEYVQLIDVSPKNGEAAVLFAALQSGGFDVAVECDIRGWMYWYKPFMALVRPITIWVHRSQLEDALGYVTSPVECAPSDDDCHAGFWRFAQASRRPAIAGLFAIMIAMGY